MITRVKDSSNTGKVIQKFLLYLILANLILMGLYIAFDSELTFGSDVLLTALLLIYNLLLCHLVSLRARRFKDDHIVYPVICVSILLCAVVCADMVVT